MPDQRLFFVCAHTSAVTRVHTGAVTRAHQRCHACTHQRYHACTHQRCRERMHTPALSRVYTPALSHVRCTIRVVSHNLNFLMPGDCSPFANFVLFFVGSMFSRTLHFCRSGQLLSYSSADDLPSGYFVLLLRAIALYPARYVRGTQLHLYQAEWTAILQD